MEKRGSFGGFVMRRMAPLGIACVLVSVGCSKVQPERDRPPFGESASLETLTRGPATALARKKSFRFSTDVHGDSTSFWSQSRAGAAKTDGSQWWAYTFQGIRLPPENEWPNTWTSIGRWRKPGWFNTHFKEIGCRQPYEKFNNRACAMSLAENFVAVWGLGDDPNSIKKQLSGYIDSLKTATPQERARASTLLRLNRTETSHGERAYVYRIDLPDAVSTYRNGERREIGVSTSGLPLFSAIYVVDDKTKQLLLHSRSEIYGFNEKVVQPEDPQPGQR
jgi:hypothetical protein